MGEEGAVHVSIRQMVEFICRGGDLASGGFSGPERALEGTRIHQKLQKSRSAAYRSEVPMLLAVSLEDGLCLEVEGRADGVEELMDLEAPCRIEEIKSTYASAEHLGFSYEPAHRGQLLCYGHILCEKEGYAAVWLRLTYYQMEQEKEYTYDELWRAEDLRNFFTETVEAYAKWLRWSSDHLAKRTRSLQNLQFPFPAYRTGQRTMAAYVYKTIQSGGGIFIQAPTGTGKTVSALFPALKAMANGLTSTLFYLTAKTATGLAAQDALDRLSEQKPELISITLTAKDKICPLEERNCDPENCPYAKGHYDRINQAVYAAITQYRQIGRELLRSHAETYRVCPFELGLDISTWADVIIGDYNYAFDPTASLKRFFQDQKTEYTLLVDEAHNLPDRAQSMYSAEVTGQMFFEFGRIFRGKPVSWRRALRRAQRRLIDWFDQKGEEVKEGECVTYSAPSPELVTLLSEFNTQLAECLTQEAGVEEWMELYFQVQFFLKMEEEYDESSVTYLEKISGQPVYRIFCVHPAQKLRQRYEKVRSVILFSATLLPIEYYKELLGGNDPEHPMDAIYLESPFDPAHKQVFVASGIRADYQNRERTVGAVAAVIYRAVQAREGNYMVFFPSYPYLQQVAAFFRDAYPEMTLWEQSPGMNEEEREDFLAHFQENPPWGIGFCVLGGVFSEGIDLRGRRLIGSLIVTVGLPQIGMERDLVREYMDRLCGRGFDYAYRYPGLNRVFQAAGRVIRTEEDRGIILLIDERYRERRYLKSMPPDWNPRIVPAQEIERNIREFWRKQELE